MSDLQVWDEAQFLKRVRNKKERALRLIHSVLQQTPKDITALVSAAQKNDFSACAAISHTLKGVFGNLSALQLEECMRKIECACTNENPMELSMLARNVDDSFKRLVSAFEQYIES